MATLTTAEAAIARLEAHGIRQAFGIPGSHNLPLYRCLAGSSIAHVTPRHEQGAGYAADGYARAGGGPAVCIATSGPGVLNLATAVATAYADSVPMLILAPGMSDSVAGRDTGHLHEARDQRGAMEGVAASAVRVGGPAQAAAAIDGAFAAFASGRPRPAYVEIPLDAMEATGDLPAEPPVARPPPPDREAVAAAVELLRDAERAAIVLGGGAVDAGAEALELARVLGSPVITTANGKGTVPERDPASLGASIRLRSAQSFLAQCDAVLAVGTELAESDLWRDPPLPLGGQLVRVDIDPAQRDRNARAAVAIVADASAALGAILAGLRGSAGRDRGAGTVEELRLRLRAEALADAGAYADLIRALESALGEGAILAGDSTMACYYGAVHLLPRAAPRRFLYPTGFAPLGYGIPAGIGARLAQPGRDVLVLIGDGGAMFTLPELAVASELDLTLAVVVVNDGGYGQIRREMLDRGQPPLGVELASPDFAAAARALGARGETIDDPRSLPALLGDAFAASGPTLVELRVGSARPDRQDEGVDPPVRGGHREDRARFVRAGSVGRLDEDQRAGSPAVRIGIDPACRRDGHAGSDALRGSPPRLRGGRTRDRDRLDSGLLAARVRSARGGEIDRQAEDRPAASAELAMPSDRRRLAERRGGDRRAQRRAGRSGRTPPRRPSAP